MNGVTFPVEDSQGRVVELDTVIGLVSPGAAGFEWSVDRPDCAGDPASCERLLAAAAASRRLAGTELLDLARARLQLVDGELVAYLPGTSDPRFRVRAVDSTYWDVESDDPAVLDAVRAAVPSAEDLPQPMG